MDEPAKKLNDHLFGKENIAVRVFRERFSFCVYVLFPLKVLVLGFGYGI